MGMSKKGKTGTKKLLLAWRTEQNWQGDGFKAIGAWLSTNAPGDRRSDDNDDPMFSVFAINFKMVDDSGTGSAVWVEAGANGRKRYCYGPKAVSCAPNRTPAEDTIIDGVNQAMLALEAQLTANTGSQRRGFNVSIGYRAASEGLPVAGMVMAATGS